MARIFNTYGSHMHPNDGRVVSNFIMQAPRGEAFVRQLFRPQGIFGANPPRSEAPSGRRGRACIARDWRFGDCHVDIHESLARHALDHHPFPPPRPVPPPARLVLLAGTEACARAVVPLIRSGESAEVWLVEGRFGAGTERCMAVLQAAGIGFRVLQPDAGSADARAALISRTLRRVRPGAATLVNLLDHADPDDLRTLGIRIEVIEIETPPDPARIARTGASWREVSGAVPGPLAAVR